MLEKVGSERRIDYALDRFTRALRAIGNPEQNVYSLIVSGTNGKGTTSLFLSSVLKHAGFRVGTYLSPHLQDPSERFLLNLEPIASLELEALAGEFLSVAEQFDLTYFEFLTLIFFVWASRSRLDFMVLETGLGGRLDATNVTQPLAAAITNVSFDHTEYLGNTLKSILSEKLGILRPEGLCFTGIEDPTLLAQVEEKCAELDAVYYFSKEIRVTCERIDWEGQSFSLNGYPFRVTNPSAGTLPNAALAFLMARIVFPKIPMATIQAAFSAVKTPGRLEVVQHRPRVVLSGDHNPAGVASLKESLKPLRNNQEGRLLVVCAFSPDKPYQSMYESLKEMSDEILLTQVTRLKKSLPQDYFQLGTFNPDAKSAVQEMIDSASPQDTVLVTGSLYLVGEVRSLWHERVEFLNKPIAAGIPSLRALGGASPGKLRSMGLKQNPAKPSQGAER